MSNLSSLPDLTVSILDSTDDLVWSVDLEQFGILAWNRAFETICLKRRGIRIAPGMTTAELFPAVDCWSRLFRRVLVEGSYTEDSPLFDDSTIFRLRFALLPHQGEVLGISIFAQDVTGHTLVLRDLQESEQRFRAFFDHSSDAIFLLTLDGKIEKVNRTGCEQLKYPMDELVGRSVSEFFAPESTATVQAHIRVLQKTGRVRADIVQLSRDETRVPIEIHAQVFRVGGRKRILGVARDISERKRVETALWHTQARYRQLFEDSGTAKAIFDLAGRIIICNAAYSRPYHVTPDVLEGKSLEDLFPPEQVAQFYARRDNILVHKKPESHTTEVFLPSGPKWFQSSYNPLFDDQGAITGIQIIAQDMTELHLANHRLQQNEKLESIGVLAGGIAHDFNNLLAGLSGHLELVRVNLQEHHPEEALRRLDKANQVFERAKALTKQLLTFSKGGTPVRDLHILAPMLKEWAEFALSGSDISLILDIATDLWLCECDAAQIAQVVDNLLINARQVSPPGGSILLRAENIYREGPFIAISVTDQGPGIAPEHFERVFDPFFTTKATGTGLGLATSRSVALQHGGSIEAASPPNSGSTFTLYLPALPGRRASNHPSESLDFRGQGRALVMDDEESLRDTLGEILVSMGFEVTRARNGHDALAYHHEAGVQAKPFDLALLDLTIPGGMGGLETAHRLLKSGSDAVLVAMSGYSEETDRAAQDGGLFRGILFKPFSRKELSNLLFRVMGKRSEVGEGSF